MIAKEIKGNSTESEQKKIRQWTKRKWKDYSI